VPSGVGIQTKYLIEGLLKTEKYKFVCMGGAIQHPDKRIQHVNGHGDKNQLRGFLEREKPDAILLVTDPRFFVWVWEMEDEIRAHCPILYWHVWDNDPSPDFNNIYYDATDGIGCISLKTYGVLQDLKYKNFKYIPHALPTDLFKPLPEEEVAEFKENHYGPHKDKKFIVMWNNRNARRKQTGDVIAAFAKFAKQVGKDNVALFMHTAVHDQEGQDVLAVAKKCGIEKQLIISEQRVQADVINKYYNVADAVINIASNEGFGLATLESLYSGTPIIVHMTGGLQFQIGDWYKRIKKFSNQDKLTDGAKKAYKDGTAKFFGVPVFPASRSCTGSQQIPYIYDDRVCHEDVIKALVKLYKMSKEDRKQLGADGREWALETFGLDEMVAGWDDLFTSTMEKFVPVSMRRATI
jgi:glycosyltransferase involved in cell wall biosynthesis